MMQWLYANTFATPNWVLVWLVFTLVALGLAAVRIAYRIFKEVL